MTKHSSQIVRPPPDLPPPQKGHFTFSVFSLSAPPSGWHFFCLHVSASLTLIFIFSPYFTLLSFDNYQLACLSVLLVTLFVLLLYKIFIFQSASLCLLSLETRQCLAFPINNRQFFNIKSEGSIPLLVRQCQWPSLPKWNSLLLFEILTKDTPESTFYITTK